MAIPYNFLSFLPVYCFQDIVAINLTDKKQPFNMTFNNLEGLASLKVCHTSATENLKKVGEVPVSDNKTAFPMMPQSIITFSGKITKRNPQ